MLTIPLRLRCEADALVACDWLEERSAPLAELLVWYSRLAEEAEPPGPPRFPAEAWEQVRADPARFHVTDPPHPDAWAFVGPVKGDCPPHWLAICACGRLAVAEFRDAERAVPGTARPVEMRADLWRWPSGRTQKYWLGQCRYCLRVLWATTKEADPGPPPEGPATSLVAEYSGRVTGDAVLAERVRGLTVKEYNDGGTSGWYLFPDAWADNLGRPRFLYLVPAPARRELKRRVLGLFPEVEVIVEAWVPARNAGNCPDVVGEYRGEALHFDGNDLAAAGFVLSASVPIDVMRREGGRVLCHQVFRAPYLVPPEPQGRPSREAVFVGLDVGAITVDEARALLGDPDAPGPGGRLEGRSPLAAARPWLDALEALERGRRRR